MKRVGKILIASMLGFSLFGCTSKDYPETGGITDYTNPNAPKEIQSKNIVEFSTSFFAFDKYDRDIGSIYDVKIVDNENHEHVFTINGRYEHEMIVDDQVFVQIQEIIDQYELVKWNGLGKVTAGLAPEYGPWRLHVLYDSEEELSFYENGEPEADWTSALRDYFVDLLIDDGVQEALPPEEALTIENFSMTFDVDGDKSFYGLITLEDDQTYLWHYIEDIETYESKIDEMVIVDDTLFTGLQNIIEEYQMDILHSSKGVTFHLEPDKNGFLEIYIDYVSGRQIYGEYEKDELPEQWPQMKEALISFFTQYISEHELIEME